MIRNQFKYFVLDRIKFYSVLLANWSGWLSFVRKEIINDYLNFKRNGIFLDSNRKRAFNYTKVDTNTIFNFDYEPAKEIQKTLITLWNTYAFWVNYAILDKIDHTKLDFNIDQLTEIDRWIYAKLQELIKYANINNKNLAVPLFLNKFKIFVDDLSNWYVRRNRRRFWKSDCDVDKLIAYYTLYNVLVTLIKLIKPIAPIMTEEMYQNLVVSHEPFSPKSIFQCELPKIDELYINKKLVEDINNIISIIKTGRLLRNMCNIKVRQPIAELIIRPDISIDVESIKKYEYHIIEELNIKKLTFIESDADIVKYNIRIDYNKLVPKYRQEIFKIENALLRLNVDEVRKLVKDKKKIAIKFENKLVNLEPNDIIIDQKSKKNIIALENKGSLIGIDTFLTDDLLSEGVANDLVRYIKEFRKEAYFNKNDQIYLYYEGSDKVKNIFNKHADYIKLETLSLKINKGLPEDIATREIKVSGEKVKLGFKKLIHEE